MKKRFTRVAAALLCVLLLASSLSVPARAEDWSDTVVRVLGSVAWAAKQDPIDQIFLALGCPFSYTLYEYAKTSNGKAYDCGESSDFCYEKYVPQSILDQIHHHQSVQNKLNKLLPAAKADGTASDSLLVTFGYSWENLDISLSLHSVTVTVTVAYDAGRDVYRYDIWTYDKYDFDWCVLFKEDGALCRATDYIGTVGAAISALGALSAFDVNIYIHGAIQGDGSGGTAAPVEAPAPTEPSSPSTTPSPSVTTVVSRYYRGSDYNEGWYDGEWRDGRPNGQGVLTYGGFEDGKYYALQFSDGTELKAIYYEGGFSDGARSGYGAVAYEGGYRDEGTFYGWWQAGKTVFEGKRWLVDGARNGYWPVTLTATSTTSATASYGAWQSAVTLSVASAEEDTFICVIPKDYKLYLYTSATATDSEWYLSPQAEAYRRVCDARCVLSDGSVRYRYTDGDGRVWYFDFDSGMTLQGDSRVAFTKLESGGDGYENAVYLEWTGYGRYDELLVYRIDESTGVETLIYATDPYDQTYDGGMYDWPPHAGKYTYRVLDAASMYSVYAGYEFRLTPGKAMSEAQIAASQNELLLTAAAGTGGQRNAVVLRWYNPSGSMLQVYRTRLANTRLDQREAEKWVANVYPWDEAYDAGMVDWPENGDAYVYHVVDTGTGVTASSDVCWFSVSEASAMTAAQKDYLDHEVGITVGGSGADCCLEAYVDSTAGRDELVWWMLGSFDRTATVVAARYVGGRLAEVQMKSMDFSDLPEYPGFAFDAAEVSTYKLFLCDGTSMPLCPSWDSTKHYSYINGGTVTPTE